MVPVSLIIHVIVFVVTFHLFCVCTTKSYILESSRLLSKRCLFPEIATSITTHVPSSLSRIMMSASSIGMFVSIIIIIIISFMQGIYTYKVSQEECARLRESVPYVKVYQYNPKHLYPKLNGFGDSGQRILKL